MSLKGQVALVTGAGSGIGEALCRSLAVEGCSIALCGRRVAELERVAASLSTETLCVSCDVSDVGSTEAAVQAAVGHFGKMHILVNNAGVFRPAPFEQLTTNAFDEAIATNLRGAFLMSKAAWPHLCAAHGQVVFLSSVAGTRGFPGSAAYCASKFGMNGLAEVLKIEGNPQGVRVLTICPGSVDTASWSGTPHEVRMRMMRSEQVAEVVTSALTSPRGLDFQPIVVVNFSDPFEI